MKIIIASYQSIMLNPGGPSYKTLQMKEGLLQAGIDAELFDMWNKNLKFGKNDLVHLFNASISTYALAKNLSLNGTRYVVNPIFFSNHSAKTLRNYQRFEKPFRNIFKRSISDYKLTKSICNGAEMVLPNTKEEGDLLVNGLGIEKNKIRVIHNGVEKRFANANPKLFVEKYGLNDFILYVGHLGPVRKNGLNIIKALRQIDHPVVIIANVLKNDEGQKCLENIAESKNITHINWLDHDDPLFASAYAACKTFILPTRYETPGRAALEAGLAGANIVITPFGGTKEYFGNMVDYPDPHSIESIKNTIKNSLNKPKSNKLKNHIIKNFIWEIIVQKTIKIYKEIIDK
ncbi:MAG: glycosyltransferase [Candidatus Cloacimonadota bacterium]|nr:glycosyltransferase [Candidatus Cloacimonadota bacterium]